MPHLSLGALVVSWIWAVRLTRRLRRQQLAGTVQERGLGFEPAASARRAALPAPGITPREAEEKGKGIGWAMLLLGGALASAGGLVLLGVVLGVSMDGPGSTPVGDLVIGSVLIGGIPLALGLLLFRAGLARIRPPG